MNYLQQIQRGVDYIEAHLDDEIALANVARVAGISQWHFQRIFKALTNETLKTYIRSRRLAMSLDSLLATDTRILDIALTAGFQTQESFTRAFKKHFGTTPNEYRKLGQRSTFLRKIQFDASYLEHINQNISLAPEIENLEPMHLLGLETPFYSVDSDKNNISETLPWLWEKFLPRISDIERPVPGMAYGVIRQEARESERLRYTAAMQVSEPYSVPSGMSAVLVPGAMYAKFTHRGSAESLDRTVNYIYSTWLAQSGLQHTYGPDLEFYGPAYKPASQDSEIVYAIPIEA